MYTSSQNTDPNKAAYGENSPGVLALQQKLNGMGANLAQDSKYGPLTQAAYNKYLGGLTPQPTNSTTPINPAQIQNTTPPTFPPTSQGNASNDYYNMLINGFAPGNIQSASTLQGGVDKAQGNVDSNYGEINKLLTELGGQPAFAEGLQGKYDISGKNAELDQLNNNLTSSANAYQQRYLGIEGQHIPKVFVTAQAAESQRQAAFDLGAQAAVISAKQGNLERANTLIEGAIKQKYEPMKEQLDRQLKFYDLNKDILTGKQKEVADRQALILQNKRDEIEKQEAEAQDVSKIMMTAAQYGAPQSVIQAINRSGTLSEALINAKGFLRDPQEMAIKRAQLAKLNQSLSISGQKTINPKVLNTTQFKNAQAAVNLKSTLQKTIDAVKKYGNKEKWNATGRGILDTLKVQLRSEISTALEQGVVQPGEAASFDSIAGQLQKSFIRDKKTIGSLQSLVSSMDNRVSMQKAALTNTYKITPDEVDTLLNINEISDQDFQDMDALVE